jgi:hypothetical protein
MNWSSPEILMIAGSTVGVCWLVRQKFFVFGRGPRERVPKVKMSLWKKLLLFWGIIWVPSTIGMIFLNAYIKRSVSPRIWWQGTGSTLTTVFVIIGGLGCIGWLIVAGIAAESDDA